MRVDYRRAFRDGVEAMVGLEQAVHNSPLVPALLELVRIRAPRSTASPTAWPCTTGTPAGAGST
ncbi:hypothetical protein [Streptomyces lydicus]|uniref:hypothetical protein n=1 Tax=Streptomyces lydicus TaxID=47763 RepID=UPI00286FE075|nr:hypothetical protein [Streptomyces lydicus]